MKRIVMKRRVAMLAAFSAVLSLSACGGGGGDDGGASPSVGGAKVYDAPTLVKTDTVLGTGAEVLAGKTIAATYDLWLYDSTKSDFKGAHVQGPASSTFTLNAGVIAGWVQGIPGMKVGGKRTLIVPSSLAYGAAGRPGIPSNSGLVFEVQVTATN